MDLPDALVRALALALGLLVGLLVFASGGAVLEL